MDNRSNKKLKRGYDINRLFTIHVELTTTCQAACPNCARNMGGKTLPWLKTQELYLDDIKNILQDSNIFKKSSILLCGGYGDPCASRDLLPIVSWFREQQYEGPSKDGRYIQINTNGGLRNKDFWQQLAKLFPKSKSALGHVVFSVDGLEDTNHIYRKGVNWENVWENMNTFSQADGNGTWEFLVFSHNEHQVEKAKEVSKQLGFKFVPKRPLGFDSVGKIDSQKYMHTYDNDGKYEYSLSPAGSTKTFSPLVLEDMMNDTPSSNLTQQVNDIPLTEQEEVYSKQATIKCRSLGLDKTTLTNTQDIYIKSDGHLLPCCHLDIVTYARSYNFGCQQVKKRIDNVYDKLDVIKNNLDELIFSSTMQETFFDPMSLESAKKGKPMFCVETCGDIAPKDLTYRKYNSRNSSLVNEWSDLLGI